MLIRIQAEQTLQYDGEVDVTKEEYEYLKANPQEAVELVLRDVVSAGDAHWVDINIVKKSKA